MAASSNYVINNNADGFQIRHPLCKYIQHANVLEAPGNDILYDLLPSCLHIFTKITRTYIYVYTKFSRLGSRNSDVFVFSSVLLNSTCCDCVRIISSLADGCMLGDSGRGW